MLKNRNSNYRLAPSSEAFNAEEVNRILAGLTPEQKANINKLTGAEQSQKIHLDPKDLRGSGNINVIVQFKVDPVKIQIIKQSLANGGATINNQAFASEYSEAFNGVSLTLPKNMVKTLANNPEVASIWPQIEYHYSLVICK